MNQIDHSLTAANSDTLAGRLQEARKSARMSQEEAAAQSAISKKTLSNYESGATIPRADRLLGLARLYKLPVTWFLVSGENVPRL